MDPKRYHYIEHEILRLVLQDTDHLGHPTDLSQLTAFFRRTLPDITSRELVDTLKRLRPQYLMLCKYISGQPNCVDYDQVRNDDEFFYRGGGFRLRRTPFSDPRLQELAALFPAPEPELPKKTYGFQP